MMKRPLVMTVWIVVAISIGALLEAAIVSRMWQWFLAAQYGPGPSLGAWYGVSGIVHVLTHHLTRKTGKTDAKVLDLEVREVVSATLAMWAYLAFCLLIMFGVGYVFGWIR